MSYPPLVAQPPVAPRGKGFLARGFLQEKRSSPLPFSPKTGCVPTQTTSTELSLVGTPSTQEAGRLRTAGSAFSAVRSILGKANPRRSKLSGAGEAATMEELVRMSAAASDSDSDSASDAESEASDLDDCLRQAPAPCLDGCSAAELVAANPKATAKELVAMLSTLRSPPAKKDVMNAFLLAQGARVAPSAPRPSKRRPPARATQKSRSITGLERLPCLRELPAVRLLPSEDSSSKPDFDSEAARSRADKAFGSEASALQLEQGRQHFTMSEASRVPQHGSRNPYFESEASRAQHSEGFLSEVPPSDFSRAPMQGSSDPAFASERSHAACGGIPEEKPEACEPDDSTDCVADMPSPPGSEATDRGIVRMPCMIDIPLYSFASSEADAESLEVCARVAAAH